MKNDNKNKKPKASKSIRILAIISIFAGVLIFLYQHENNLEQEVKEVKYTTFLKQAEEDKVDVVYYSSKSDNVTYTLKDSETTYTFTNPDSDEFKLSLLEKGLDVQKQSKVGLKESLTFFMQFLSALYPVILIVFMLGFLKNTPIFQSNKEPVAQKDIPNISFSDIAGLKSVKKELDFMIEFLQNPKKFDEKNVYMPAGLLLYGPPGTGKTMLAKAIAGEAHVPFFYMSGSDFVELYVGNGAKKVRELFKAAKENTPCIIFIDEIDALARPRGSSNNQESDQTINAFLAEIDGFNSSQGILVIGATNLIESLDSAFIRPGRFDKHICVPLPETKEERLELFNLYSKNKKFDKDVDFLYWAKQTVWFSGADIKAMINDAALKSLMAGEEAISNSSIQDAFYEKLTKGHKKERTEEENKLQTEIVAWHESGHALIGKLLCKISIPSVTIIGSTSGVGGFTLTLSEKTGLFTKEELLNEVTLAYGGRIAEELLTGSKDLVTTGASNDIKNATKTLKAIVERYGMSDDYGMLDLTVIDYQNNKEVIDVIKSISEECYTTGFKVLSENIELLKECANCLIEKETIDEQELDTLIQKHSH